ncbi:MAG: response regulator, partial [Candidatus Acidiferrum sp.]
QAVCAYLSRTDFDVIPAENGKVGVALARANQFDLILMDMQMPELDGYQATKQIRGAGFRGPIIALTGDTRPGVEKNCFDSGCDIYIPKPWDPAVLLESIQKALEPNGKKAEMPATVPPGMPADSQIALLAAEFARTLPSTVDDMKVALAAGDRTRVARLAHRTGGAAGIFGLRDLSGIARALEEAERSGQSDERFVELARQFVAAASHVPQA